MIICLMGITCSGKDTLAEKLASDEIGLIQVGKEFRKRYPPEYFQGLAASDKTDDEAWKIFNEQYELNKDKKHIIVVGMPRLVKQVKEFLKRFNIFDIHFYLLTVADEELMKRIDNRFSHDKEGWKILALERIKNDKIQLCETIIEILKNDLNIEILDTSNNLDLIVKHIKESL